MCWEPQTDVNAVITYSCLMGFFGGSREKGGKALAGWLLSCLFTAPSPRELLKGHHVNHKGIRQWKPGQINGAGLPGRREIGSKCLTDRQIGRENERGRRREKEIER